MTDEPVGCAVVGLGVMGRAHAAILLSLPDARLIACADIDPRKSAECPPGIPFTTDLDTALGAAGVKAVIVATPPDSHRHVVERAAARGLGILCEKPLAGNLEDADAMVRASSEGARVFIGHVTRFDPRYRAVQAALAAGGLGALISISAWLNSDVSEQVYYAPRTTLAREMAVHHLDVFRWLGGEVTRISGELARTRDLDAGLVASVRFQSGAVGNLQVSWALPEGSAVDHGISVIASSGVARIDATTPPMPDALRQEVTTFLECIRGRAEWPLTLSDARAALALSVALEEALATGAVVELGQLRAGPG